MCLNRSGPSLLGFLNHHLSIAYPVLCHLSPLPQWGTPRKEPTHTLLLASPRDLLIGPFLQTPLY